jgi:hypothetical protein
MHMTPTEWIWFTAAVSILGTAAVFLLWIWFTRRAHRGEHGRHDPNNSPAAVTAGAAKPSRAWEPFCDFQARLKANQRCHNGPHHGGRHAAPEPATTSSPTATATVT